MPGPISDSYDCEFGTGENADRVREAVSELVQRVTDIIGSDQLRHILSVVDGQDGPKFKAALSERDWRIIRFCLNRAVEDI